MLINVVLSNFRLILRDLYDNDFDNDLVMLKQVISKNVTLTF